jgi:REP element-mobilizing transposase RayT
MRKSSYTQREKFKGRHRFEHWYRDNTVYFITARCRDGYRAFASEEAKAIFWNRFDHYTHQHGFVPWITSLIDNHYHTLGYLRVGEELKEMMRKLHGSVAKLVNDLLPERRVPFWREAGNKDYFDGCIRDAKQCRGAYRYTYIQPVRHGLTTDASLYPHTHISVALERGLTRALELNAFLPKIDYPRYNEVRRD